MRLRTAIALAISLSLAAVLMATVAVVSFVLDRAARSDLHAELTRGRAVLEEVLRYRKSLHRAESRILADEPRLKAVVATDDVSRATIIGVVSDLKRALRCDLLLLTDRGGRLLADATHPEEAGDPLGENPTIAAALRDGESEGIWTDGPKVFQVHARRLSYGAMSVGIVVLGYRIDDTLAATVGQQIGASVMIKLDRELVAISRFEGQLAINQALLVAVIGQSQGDEERRDVVVGGARYLVLTAPLPDYRGGQVLRYAIFRSLDQALAPARRVVRLLYGITTLALLLALVAAVVLSRRLSRPVDELVAFTRRIAGGKLEPVQVDGIREVRTLGAAMNQMVTELATSRVQLAEATRQAKELEIAQRIQMSILPRNFAVPGLTLSAQMVPASEVGGDYYDVIPVSDGCWIGIGDVAGHGLPAGMVMLMVQSAFHALVRSRPNAAPHELVIQLNQVLFENVRNRLNTDEHVTFTAARYFSSGKLVFAGAHEAPLVLRKLTASCELIPTPGTWLGVIENIRHATTDSTLQLELGDVVVFYSDGVTEAMNERREQLGIERLSSELVRGKGRSAAEIHHQLMRLVRSWSERPDDDFTILVLRHEGSNE